MLNRRIRFGFVNDQNSSSSATTVTKFPALYSQSYVRNHSIARVDTAIQIVDT